MGVRDVLLFVHILGAAAWIGAGTFGVYSLRRIGKEGGEERGRTFEFILDKATPYGVVVFLLTVLAGVGLVFTQDQWGWGDTFVLIGIGGVVVEGIWEATVARKKDKALLEALTGASPDRLAVLRTWSQTAWVDVTILLVALWAMVTKLDF
jgi:hypothetical protein